MSSDTSEVLHTKIREQVEFYFGDANLSRDSFLKEKMAENRNGYVSIDCLLTFKKLAGLTTKAEVVSDALRGSSLLEVDSGNTGNLLVKRVKEFDDSIDYTEHTVIIYPIAGDTTEQDIRLAVGKFLPETKIGAIWRKKKKHPVNKLTMHIAEIHWNESADSISFIELCDHGKKIELPSPSDLDKTEISALPKLSFEELYGRNPGNTKIESKELSTSLSDIRHKVMDLVSDTPVGAVKFVKNIPPEDIRSTIKYVHVIDSDFNRMLLLFETTEACDRALAVYNGAKTPKVIHIDDDKEQSDDKISCIKASIVEDEEVLNAVLLGYKERMKTFLGGKKNFTSRKRKGKIEIGKKKWGRR